jgi:hypothetical protein
MTTDVNFSHIAAEGKSVGLQSLYFGPQHSLQAGTPIQIDEPPASRAQNPADALEFQEWAGLFYSWEVYKVLIQQKDRTDPSYQYRGMPAEPLTIEEGALSTAERRRLAEVEKRLGR